MPTSWCQPNGISAWAGLPAAIPGTSLDLAVLPNTKTLRQPQRTERDGPPRHGSPSPPLPASASVQPGSLWAPINGCPLVPATAPRAGDLVLVTPAGWRQREEGRGVALRCEHLGGCGLCCLRPGGPGGGHSCFRCHRTASRAAADARGRSERPQSAAASRITGISLQEAQQILNVSNLNPEEIQKVEAPSETGRDGTSRALPSQWLLPGVGVTTRPGGSMGAVLAPVNPSLRFLCPSWRSMLVARGH